MILKTIYRNSVSELNLGFRLGGNRKSIFIEVDCLFTKSDWWFVTFEWIISMVDCFDDWEYGFWKVTETPFGLQSQLICKIYFFYKEIFFFQFSKLVVTKFVVHKNVEVTERTWKIMWTFCGLYYVLYIYLHSNIHNWSRINTSETWKNVTRATPLLVKNDRTI